MAIRYEADMATVVECDDCGTDLETAEKGWMLTETTQVCPPCVARRECAIEGYCIGKWHQPAGSRPRWCRACPEAD